MSRLGDVEIIDKFEQFYREYYRNEIGQLAQKYPDEKRSLYIEWDDLHQFDPDIADDFIAQPGQMRDYAEEALRLYDLPVDVKLGQAHVRVRNLHERMKLADLRANHRGQLISVYGTIKNASSPRSVPSEAAFECQRCGTLSRIPQPAHTDERKEPHECQGCERQGPFELNADQTEFTDEQTLLLEQRGPDGADSDTESIVVDVEDDLVGEVSIGDHVTVTGILHIEEQGHYNDGSLSDKYLSAVAIDSSGPLEYLTISDRDKQQIVELSHEDDLYKRMVDSIAPSVFNNDDAKLALALQLFGGVTKHLPDGERIRGDIHILLVGDPASGPARLIRHSARLAPRSMRVSGKTTTQAGLTATAHMSGGKGSPWDVEGGALVLADKGLTAIDRLDAMRQETRATLPTILDEQSVHVTKATITETLDARTSVLAEATPKYGRFDQYEPIGKQVDLEPDLISQFDLLFILTDNPERSSDETEADHIINVNYSGELQANRNSSLTPDVDSSSAAEATEEVSPAIDPDLLRRYISYARDNCYPVLTDEAKEVIQKFYVDVRSQGYDDDAPVPVTSRKLEAIVRLAEASARLRLSDTIEKEDANRVTKLVRETLESLGIDTETSEVDAGVSENEQSKAPRALKETVKEFVEKIESEYDQGAPIKAVLDHAEERGINRSKAESEIDKLRRQGDVYEPTTDHLRAI